MDTGEFVMWSLKESRYGSMTAVAHDACGGAEALLVVDAVGEDRMGKACLVCSGCKDCATACSGFCIGCSGCCSSCSAYCTDCSDAAAAAGHLREAIPWQRFVRAAALAVRDR